MTHSTFKPTWKGFLDTTEDAMTIVEAALQGRLIHTNHRPYGQRRLEMLTSGTVILYEERASGIKRWTDGAHWSPSRVMNNYLIYRQLIRPLNTEEKISHPESFRRIERKRKRYDISSSVSVGGSPCDTNSRGNNTALHSTLLGDPNDRCTTPVHLFESFAKSLTFDQQRRFCGSLVDSYNFQEAGLMKKTISVKYYGSHYHIVSYYTLEDVVCAKLRRPYQDPLLVDIRPRLELLVGWKVALEHEKKKNPAYVDSSRYILPAPMQQYTMWTRETATGVPEMVHVSQQCVPGLLSTHPNAETYPERNGPVYNSLPPICVAQRTSDLERFQCRRHHWSPYSQPSSQMLSAQATGAQQYNTPTPFPRQCPFHSRPAIPDFDPSSWAKPWKSRVHGDHNDWPQL